MSRCEKKGFAILAFRWHSDITLYMIDLRIVHEYQYMFYSHEFDLKRAAALSLTWILDVRSFLRKSSGSISLVFGSV